MEYRIGDWIQTYRGERFYPFDPREEEIHIEDIVHALALTCRFNGHCRVFYSVAEHSVRVSQLCPPGQELAGLLHDAAEAYLADIPRPVKWGPGMEAYRRTETALQAAINHRFGLPGAIPKAVRASDDLLLATEARDLMGVQERGIYWTSLADVQPLPERIEPWSWQEAEQRFLGEFRELIGQRGAG